MKTQTIRTLWKKAMPFVFGAVVVGSAGSALAHKYLGGGDCCRPGAACCVPGAACCHSAHKIAQK